MTKRSLEEIAELLEPDRMRQQLEAMKEQITTRIHEKFAARQVEQINPTLSPTVRKQILAQLATEIIGLDELLQQVESRLSAADEKSDEARAILSGFKPNRAARRRSQPKLKEVKSA